MDRIEINTEIRFGKPCIRGTRIAVQDILELLAAGETQTSVAKEYDLQEGDVSAALHFSAREIESKFMAAE